MADQPTYRLSGACKWVTWSQWIDRGGCGIPNDSRAPSILGPESRWGDRITLAQIGEACPYTGRTLARFAAEHLKNDLYTWRTTDECLKRGQYR